MVYDNTCFFLPLQDVWKRLALEPCPEARKRGTLDCITTCLGLDGGRDAGARYGQFRGLWGLVLVELHHYPISDRHAWLPHQHEYAGKMGTRVQAQAERYVDLMQFKLYLRTKIDAKYRVPG